LKIQKNYKNNFEKVLFDNNFYYLSYISILSRQVSQNSDISIIFLINILLSEIIVRKLRKYDLNYILFTQRDCCNIYNIFKTFYPNFYAKKFYVSREAMLKPSNNFLIYYKKNIKKDCLIFDMNGTGLSIFNFCNVNHIDFTSKTKILYAILFNNQKSHTIINEFSNKIDYISKDVECIDVLEIINLDIFGKIIDFNFIPIRKNVTYDLSIVYNIHSSLLKTTNLIKKTKIINKLIKELEEIDYDSIVNLLVSITKYVKKTSTYNALSFFHRNDT